MMVDCYCRFKKSVNKKLCTGICTSCDIMDEYKKLLNEGKIDIIDDLANFRPKGGDNNGKKGNKCNKKRTVSKSGKKFKVNN